MRLIGRHPPTPREIWAVIITLAPGDSSLSTCVVHTEVTRARWTQIMARRRNAKQTIFFVNFIFLYTMFIQRCVTHLYGFWHHFKLELRVTALWRILQQPPSNFRLCNSRTLFHVYTLVTSLPFWHSNRHYWIYWPTSLKTNIVILFSPIVVTGLAWPGAGRPAGGDLDGI